MVMQLPVELWTLIAERCDTGALAALCRASKQFHVISEPQLYRCPTLVLMAEGEELEDHTGIPFFWPFFIAMRQYPGKRALVKWFQLQNSPTLLSARARHSFGYLYGQLKDDECVELALTS